MITIKDCNIFDNKFNVVINPVNCDGVMGAGLAKRFKEKYPDMYEDYRKQCINKRLLIGKLHVYRVNENLTIINFPTKDSWRENSKYEYILKGLKELNKYLISSDKRLSVGIPALGCGLGGLEFLAVSYLISRELNNCKQNITLIKPKEE